MNDVFIQESGNWRVLCSVRFLKISSLDFISYGLLKWDEGFQAVTAVKIQVEVIWVPPKRWYPVGTLHGVTTQKTSLETRCFMMWNESYFKCIKQKKKKAHILRTHGKTYFYKGLLFGM
jgi:hypothetical protein